MKLNLQHFHPLNKIQILKLNYPNPTNHKKLIFFFGKKKKHCNLILNNLSLIKILAKNSSKPFIFPLMNSIFFLVKKMIQRYDTNILLTQNKDLKWTVVHLKRTVERQTFFKRVSK